MAGNKRDKMESDLAQLVRGLRAAAGDNLHSVVLYGSAASSEFHENFSDVNVLCLLNNLSASTLASLRESAEWRKKQRQSIPLFLTVEELRQSADVFAIELLDMQRHHRVLYGADAIADLQVPLRLHRVQVEHELRTKLILFRQSVVVASGSKDILRLMLDSVSTFMTLFRHALIAMGEQPETGKPAMLQQLKRKVNADTGTFQELLNVREGSVKPETLDPTTLLPPYLKTIEQVIAVVDRL